MILKIERNKPFILHLHYTYINNFTLQVLSISILIILDTIWIEQHLQIVKVKE